MPFLLALALSACAGTAAPEGSAEDLHAWLQSAHSEYRELDPDIAYKAAVTDLNGDGRNEAVVQIIGPVYCGTGGCGFQVYTYDDGAWRLLTDMAIGHLPLRLLETRSHGWRDIGVIVAGGGAAPGYQARLRFDGRSYPTNPSVPPAEPIAGRVGGEILIPVDAPARPLF